MRYYVADEKHPKGFVEVTETEYNALFGDKTIRPYAQAVYHNEMAIDDVPVELKASVQMVVDNRINRWGLYDNTFTEKEGENKDEIITTE